MKKKKRDAAPSGRPAASAKKQPEMGPAAGRLRDAKNEFKRLKLLVKAAKREVKESRKALKKLRKAGAPRPPVARRKPGTTKGSPA